MSFDQNFYTKPHKLCYTPQGENKTFIMLVDKEMYDRQKNGENVPVQMVPDSYDVYLQFKGATHDNDLQQASEKEISDCFGTNSETNILQFMLDHGSIEP